MKKILSLGVAAAVLSMTAVAASAAFEASILGDAAVAGETITVEVKANAVTVTDVTFTVDASDNLTLVEAVKGGTGFVEFNAETGVLAWANSEAPADGTVFLTLTYTVDAAADEEISVTLVPSGDYADAVSAVPATAVVVDGADETIEDLGTEETFVVDTVESYETEVVDTADVTEDITIVDTAETVVDTADTADTSDNQVDTGIALAVVPAVLAGAAIVVAKKRK